MCVTSVVHEDTTEDLSIPAEESSWSNSQNLINYQQLQKIFYVCNHLGSGKQATAPLKIRVKGSAICLYAVCSAGHIFTWKSQPTVGKTYLANIAVSSAVFLTGNSFSSFLELCEVLRLQT